MSVKVMRASPNIQGIVRKQLRNLEEEARLARHNSLISEIFACISNCIMSYNETSASNCKIAYRAAVDFDDRYLVLRCSACSHLLSITADKKFRSLVLIQSVDGQDSDSSESFTQMYLTFWESSSGKIVFYKHSEEASGQISKESFQDLVLNWCLVSHGE